MIPMLIFISIVSFIIIQLPPGDFLSMIQAQLHEEGYELANDFLKELRQRYGLDQPVHIQYLKWVGGIIMRGDFGYSFIEGKGVSELILERLPWTLLLAFGSMFLAWFFGIPIGIYSATHKYSLGDHSFTLVGYIGLSIPNFFLALMLMTILVFAFDVRSVTGLFSMEYARASWDWDKLVDLLKHLWIPLVVISTASTASIIRTMRGNLLDILGQQYVQVARAKGLKENRVIYMHALRNSIHPLIMTFGLQLPVLISGETVVSIVSSLPTTGLLFYNSILAQDMYVASTFLMLLTVMLLFGNLMADLLLAVVDPRIRFD